MEDEIWTTRDGRRLPVESMSESHVKNVLRMLLRRQRQTEITKAVEQVMRLETTIGEAQDMLHAEAMMNLANPNCFFPGLEGGVYGSPELQAKYRY